MAGTEQDPTAEAERLMRRRRNQLLGLTIGFLAMQVMFVAAAGRLIESIPAGSVRLVDALSVVASIAWALALVGNLSTGGRHTRSASAAVREILEDELTKSNRGAAFRVGYVALFLGTCALFVASLFWPADAVAALPLLIAFGAASPVIAFWLLDRRGEG